MQQNNENFISEAERQEGCLRSFVSHQDYPNLVRLMKKIKNNTLEGNAVIIIYGDISSGKTMLARIFHQMSERTCDLDRINWTDNSEVIRRDNPSKAYLDQITKRVEMLIKEDNGATPDLHGFLGIANIVDFAAAHGEFLNIHVMMGRELIRNIWPSVWKREEGDRSLLSIPPKFYFVRVCGSKIFPPYIRKMLINDIIFDSISQIHRHQHLENMIASRTMALLGLVKVRSPFARQQKDTIGLVAKLFYSFSRAELYRF